MPTAHEKCDRCGSLGYDRRTLWMGCGYNMAEIDVPFGEKEVHHINRTRTFYTLYVCKSCRSDWLTSIESWFDKKPTEPDYDSVSEPKPEPDQNTCIKCGGTAHTLNYRGKMVDGISRSLWPDHEHMHVTCCSCHYQYWRYCDGHVMSIIGDE